ncbi:hypothetical protein [Subtercola sp. YIM 133946]|uniref:hypothetical protein n=1 Tax=Subtercola sp. YIM 133946 TaxID=3118909 RepID=UPI002F9310C4
MSEQAAGPGPLAARDAPRVTRADLVLLWASRVVATGGVIVSVWAAIATGAMLVHGHPAYAVLLTVVFAVSAVFAVLAWRRRPAHRRAAVLRGILLALSVVMIAATAWLVPSSRWSRRSRRWPPTRL